MSDLFWLSDAQMARLEPYFPKSHGKPRVDDRRVLCGIIFVIADDAAQTCRASMQTTSKPLFVNP